MVLKELFSFITSSPSVMPDAGSILNPDASRVRANNIAEKAGKVVVPTTGSLARRRLS